MQRDADDVEALRVDGADVVLGDVVLAVLAPELGSAGWTDELDNEFFDLRRRLRAALEAPHVALGNHPVAEVRAAQQQWFAAAVDDFLAAGVNELRLRERRNGKQGDEAEGEADDLHADFSEVESLVELTHCLPKDGG